MKNELSTYHDASIVVLLAAWTGCTPLHESRQADYKVMFVAEAESFVYVCTAWSYCN